MLKPEHRKVAEGEALQVDVIHTAKPRMRESRKDDKVRTQEKSSVECEALPNVKKRRKKMIVKRNKRRQELNRSYPRYQRELWRG